MWRWLRRSIPAPADTTVRCLRVLTVAGIGPETAVPRVDGLLLPVVIPEGGELWQDVGIRRTGTASTTSITVRQAGIVDESFVKHWLVVDVLGGILGRYHR